MDGKKIFKKELTLAELEASGRIIYSVVSGSHAYGTNTPESDVDLRGYYWVPPKDYISLYDIQPQTDDTMHDICYYTLKRAFDLLKTANPNQIELLWMPKDCVKISVSPIMDEMIAHRDLFISRKTYFTHASYASQQIKKAKGKNKKVHNPQPETMPCKEDFCRVIDMNDVDNQPEWVRLFFVKHDLISLDQFVEGPDPLSLPPLSQGAWKSLEVKGKFPFRPVPLKESGIDLKHFHVSSLEHIPNAFRLYDYGDNAKGVFRGDQILCCESIPMDDEKTRFRGLLTYNKNEFDKALKEWNSYWDWVRNRNDARWIDQEKGLVDFDAKNMMHCMRLMMSAEHILQHGEPLVRFEGKTLDYLMKIRRSEVAYEKIMEDVEARDAKLKELYDISTLPKEADMDKLEDLYRYLILVGMKTMK